MQSDDFEKLKEQIRAQLPDWMSLPNQYAAYTTITMYINTYRNELSRREGRHIDPLTDNQDDVIFQIYQEHKHDLMTKEVKQ